MIPIGLWPMTYFTIPYPWGAWILVSTFSGARSLVPTHDEHNLWSPHLVSMVVGLILGVHDSSSPLLGGMADGSYSLLWGSMNSDLHTCWSTILGPTHGELPHTWWAWSLVLFLECMTPPCSWEGIAPTPYSREARLLAHSYGVWILLFNLGEYGFSTSLFLDTLLLVFYTFYTIYWCKNIIN